MLPSFLKRHTEFDLFPLEEEHLTLAADLHRKRFSPSWSAGEFRKLLAYSPVYGPIVRPCRRGAEAGAAPIPERENSAAPSAAITPVHSTADGPSLALSKIRTPKQPTAAPTRSTP